MSDLTYIDSYFKRELTAEEIRNFDQKVKDDPVFAEEVAFYCSSMHAIKNQLAEEKKKQFRKIYDERKTGSNTVKPSLIKRLWPYMTAAVIAGLIVGGYIFLKPSSPQQLADQYIRQHFKVELGVKMTGKEDSLDAAIRLYNKNKLPEALLLLEKIIQADSTADNPKKIAGIVSLRIGEYDKAIEYFTQLENLQLSINPGKLYHALALIKRNRSGDKEMAKQLLKQVMDQNLDEKEAARKLWKSL
jgi:tetratricopeptide (TPR) repeat protein